MINKETKEWAPVPRFLDAVQLTEASPTLPMLRAQDFFELHDEPWRS